ncbi:MAG: M20/M25/M40 family metallo-hydrolase [Anaerolineales bacterium]|nr:M20/M25/M40 family metallo-hydrolase [Anaerolineales bacterium]MDW8161884.1 M20/M25/M40 family metallo-hydrolase [Anaerolineales bacterium]
MYAIPNWQQATQETVDHLSRLIRAESVNPPGNELPAILAIKEILEQEGLRSSDDFVILESAPQRVNLVARLRGDGSERPLLLSGHVDVVPVERDKWSRDPFGGEVVNGEVWGRGAMDMKGFLSMYLQVFLQVRRMQLPLKRDLILAAIADEEAGFEHGSIFLVRNHRDLIDAEYGLTEGGAFTVPMGKLRIYPIQVAEKGVSWLKMTAKGKPGHGSLPHAENAVFLLARALERIRRVGHLPVHITPTYLAMVSKAARQTKFPLPLLLRGLSLPWVVKLLLRVLRGQPKTLLMALTTNTCTPTVLKAGGKTNVIPAEAFAHLDCRRLPGQSPADLTKEILAVTGEGIELEPIATSPGAAFPTDSPLYRLLEQETHRLDPEGIVIPMMMPGATDACVYREAGITMYGFTPGRVPEGFPLLSLAHGHDERLPISFIESGLPILWEVVRKFCSGA